MLAALSPVHVHGGEARIATTDHRSFVVDGSSMMSAALKRLQEIFPESSSTELSAELERAAGSVEQAADNIASAAGQVNSPTQPPAHHQVPEHFADLFPLETACPTSSALTVFSQHRVASPLNKHEHEYSHQTMPCRRHKPGVFRMWWPKALLPAHNHLPTNALQLQREHSSPWDSAAAWDSSPPGSPGKNVQHEATKPVDESIAAESDLPEFMRQLCSPANVKKSSSLSGSSSSAVSNEDHTYTARQQITQGSIIGFDEIVQTSKPEDFRVAAKQAAPVFADDNVPADAHEKLQDLMSCFEAVPRQLVANALRESDYDRQAAGEACLALLQMQEGVADWSSGSDFDTASVVTDSVAETSSPMTALKTTPTLWPQDESEKLQDLLYEDKLQKLYDQFPTVHSSDVQHHLSSAQGSYDMAAAMLYDFLENGQQQEVERQQSEAKDLAMAQELQKQDIPAVPSPADYAKVQISLPGPSTSQDSECEVFYLLNPEQKSLRAGVKELRTTYPQVPIDSLQSVLSIVNGDIRAACEMIEEHDPSLRPASSKKAAGPSRLHRESTPQTPHQWPVASDRHIEAPPGLSRYNTSVATPVHHKERNFGRQRRVEHNDIYTQARRAFKDAQDKIHMCRQGYHAANLAGDQGRQRHWAAQLEYWQQQAMQEKHKAHKKTFNTKNADVTSRFLVDLHALHVDEALDSLEEQIQNLQRFKCTWLVEVITGKGLHSVGKDPKLLPAVKGYLTDRSLECWEEPGKVVFRMAPEANQAY